MLCSSCLPAFRPLDVHSSFELRTLLFCIMSYVFVDLRVGLAN